MSDSLTNLFNSLLVTPTVAPDIVFPTIDHTQKHDGNQGRNGSEHDYKVDKVKVSIQSILAALGIICNILLIAAVIRRRGKRIRTSDIFMSQMAISQLCIAFALPFQVAQEMTNEWRFSSSFCTANEVFYHIGFHSTSMFIVVLCVDKFLEHSYPSRPLVQRLRSTVGVVITVLGVWIISVIVCAPVIMYTGKGGIKPSCKCVYKIPEQPKLLEERCEAMGIRDEAFKKACVEEMEAIYTSGPTCRDRVFHHLRVQSAANGSAGSEEVVLDYAYTFNQNDPFAHIDQHFDNLLDQIYNDLFQNTNYDAINPNPGTFDYTVPIFGNPFAYYYGGNGFNDYGDLINAIMQPQTPQVVVATTTEPGTRIPIINATNREPAQSSKITPSSLHEHEEEPIHDMKASSHCHFRRHGKTWTSIVLFNFIVLFASPVLISMGILIWAFIDVNRNLNEKKTTGFMIGGKVVTTFKEILLLFTYIVCYFPFYLVQLFKIDGISLEHSSHWCSNLTNYTVYIQYFFILFSPLICLLWGMKKNLDSDNVELIERQNSSV